MGLAFLAHASLPFTYWAKAFETAAQLINFLPSSTINYQTSHFEVYNCDPDYKFLRVFGC